MVSPNLFCYLLFKTLFIIISFVIYLFIINAFIFYVSLFLENVPDLNVELGGWHKL
ncbi:hypothetical protein THF1D04_20558 [Vibrio owensii]|uniref:Uncharacterized protein n=1 Tax=Vibrio owensii TaxID=696485 RepID=A0AAU9Q5H3_9VIBR|nr:hypothetical protein THF1D04_20558 [Vibrio owensii]